MVLLDTSGLVALFDARDANHETATRIWQHLRERRELLVTTELVVAETVALLRRRAGWDVARRTGERLVSGAVAEVVFADAFLFDQAWRIYCKYDDQVFSMIDCVSFALMEVRSIRTAFSFDKDFRVAGFDLA